MVDKKHTPSLFVMVGALALAGSPNPPSVEILNSTNDGGGVVATCSVATGPEYYAFDLVTTSRLPGSGLAAGRADVSVSPSSPFSVALASDGSYQYNIDISVVRMKKPRSGVLVAWITTREIDQVRRIGPLDDNLQARGTTEWNKFLVVITHEASDDPTAERWAGPIALRGMSRSGMMHTMAGHGAFQQENCAAYGYED